MILIGHKNLEKTHQQDKIIPIIHLGLLGNDSLLTNKFDHIVGQLCNTSL